MRLRFTADALSHLAGIRDYLNERNPAVARRILSDIRTASRRLCEFPHLGRAGDWPDTRTWAVQHSPYLIVYRLDPGGEEVVVLGVFHGSQNWQARDD
jgi:plasmid stabilization system protein ParE